MSFSPAIRLRLRSGLASFGVFYGVLVLIMTALISGVLAFGDDFNGSISATVITLLVFFFVLGICTAREDMRILIQFGVSRRTSFITRLTSAAILSLVAAAAGELLLILTRAIAPSNVAAIDLYNILYMQESLESGAAMTFLDHLRAIVMNFVLSLSCYELGEFFSLLFFRLSKRGCIIAGITLGLLPGVILPLFISIPGVTALIGPAVLALFDWMGRGVGNLALVTLAWTAVKVLVNYLLMRRAPIKAA